MRVTSGEDVSSRAVAPTGPTPEPPGDGAPAVDVPCPAADLELIGQMAGSGYRKPPSLVRRGDGQTIQLTKLLYLVLEAVDGRRSYDDIAAHVTERYGRAVRTEDVRYLVDSKLRPLGLLQRADGSTPEVKKINPLLALRLRFVVADPQVTRRITAPFAVLFFPVIVPTVLAAFSLVAFWVLFDKGLASATYQAFDRPGLLLTIFAITVVSAGFHEFGHAAAARYGGATPGAMGAGLYLIWPAFYTDVTDSYRLGRGGRLRTDLGGLYFNTITAVAAFGIWWVTHWDAFLLVIPAQIIQIIQQLTPMVRFDGYHLLADVTGVPDLYHRIKPTLLGLLPNHWGDAASKELKPWAKAVVAAWVIVVVPFIVVMLGLMVLAMPRLLATAWKSLDDQWRSLTANFGDGDILGGSANVLSIVALVIPVVGLTMILTRLVRRTSATVWRATDGRPARRMGAEVSAFALLAVLAVAWWPSDGKYRPVQAYERGTLGDAVAAIAGPTRGLEEGRGGVTQTIWPAAAEAGTGGTAGTAGTAGGDGADSSDPAPPTRDHPILAVVLVPAESADASAPTWVFPFNRPLPPEEGDNQALAINTIDGSTLYDVAFALVWVEDRSVLNVNEAYAIASCADCTTVAIGFQVVLSIGQVDVVVPQNHAVAVNYACVRCVTAALATQLVVTLPDTLSPAAMAELETLWEEIGRFGDSIEGVPLSELQSSLNDFEAQILDIIERAADIGETTTSTTTTTTSTTVSTATTAFLAGEPTTTSRGATATTAPSATTQGSTVNQEPNESTRTVGIDSIPRQTTTFSTDSNAPQTTGLSNDSNPPQTTTPSNDSTPPQTTTPNNDRNPPQTTTPSNDSWLVSTTTV